MIEIDPQQELFTMLKLALENKGYSVYDGKLPPEGTPYPFIYLRNSQLVNERVKNGIFARIFQNLSVWHDNIRERGVVSSILLDVKRTFYEIEDNTKFAYSIENLSQTITNDDTTATPLIRGDIDAEILFS